jgi:hypothetical protein
VIMAAQKFGARGTGVDIKSGNPHFNCRGHLCRRFVLQVFFGLKPVHFRRTDGTASC